MKVFADIKVIVAPKLKIWLIGSVEKIVEKRENAGYQHFPSVPTINSLFHLGL